MTTTAPPQKVHPGERLASFFENFFRTIVGVSTLGSSLTFSKLISTPVPLWQQHSISDTNAQSYLGLSWLFFILSLAITSFCACALSLWRPLLVSQFGEKDSTERRKVMWVASAISVLLFGLLIAAFAFLGLVVAAYTGGIGWTAVAMTAVAGVIGVGCIIWQSPIGSAPPPDAQEWYDHKGDAFGVGYGGKDEEKLGYEESVFDDRAEYRTRTPKRNSYAEQGLRESFSPLPKPIAAIPPYTEDLRMMRRIRASDEHDGRWGQI
jgi:hypothetical protein